MKNTIVITGGSDGIGKAAAEELAAENDVIIVGRNPEKTRTTAESIGVAYHVADFSSLDSVKELATKLEKLSQINILVNNAGGVQGKRRVTTDGYEQTFQINYLAPFLLTYLLLDKLIADKAIVINTASAANRFGKVELDNLNFEKGYTNMKAYGTSKLENILFTRALNEKYASQGLFTASFHPGVVATNFASESSPLLKFAYAPPMRKIFRFKTPQEGADTMVWLADPANLTQWDTGEYYANRKPAHIQSPQGDDIELAEQLWNETIRLLGLGQHGKNSNTAQEEKAKR